MVDTSHGALVMHMMMKNLVPQKQMASQTRDHHKKNYISHYQEGHQFSTVETQDTINHFRK
jgi:hypothetical protein